MPENFQFDKDTNSRLTEDQLNTVVSILGRAPFVYELEIIDFLLLEKPRIENVLSDSSELNQPTNNLKWVLKSGFVELKLPSETENQSAALSCNLISKVFKSNARPLAMANFMNINGNEVSIKKNTLHQVIKGTGKVSNILGIPNLKTDVLFHNNTQYLHGATIGQVCDKPQQTKTLENQRNIYILGRYKINSSKDENTVSSYHYKFLKEVLEELVKTDDNTLIETIDEGGLINSFTRIIKKYSKGLSIDISTLFDELSEQNFASMLTPQHTAILVIPEDEIKLKNIAAKWEQNCLIIGQTNAKENLHIILNNNKLANIPINQLLGNKTLFPDTNSKGKPTLSVKKFSVSNIKPPKKNRDIAWHLITNPNIASKSCVNKQYDSMVGISTMNTSFPSDAEVFNLKGTNNALALALIDKNNSIEGSDDLAAKIAMTELCRKLACSGAKPLASSVNMVISDGSTHKKKLINSIEETAKKLNIAVDFSINHSHLNQTHKIQTYFSMLGVIEDKNHHMTMSFKDKGNIIFLIGPSSENLSGSEYLISYHKDTTPYLPDFDLELESKINLAMIELVNKKLICSAHNVAKGGLFISLVESAMAFGFGFDIITDTDIRTDAFLFGEAPGRVTVSVTPNKENKFIDFMIQKELPFLAIGHVTKGEMRVDDISYGFIDDAKKEYNSALKRFLNKDF
jgi:phosphoribosylformylglycinamidine synthase subunit PurL